MKKKAEEEKGKCGGEGAHLAELALLGALSEPALLPAGTVPQPAPGLPQLLSSLWLSATCLKLQPKGSLRLFPTGLGCAPGAKWHAKAAGLELGSNLPQSPLALPPSAFVSYQLSIFFSRHRCQQSISSSLFPWPLVAVPTPAAAALQVLSRA